MAYTDIWNESAPAGSAAANTVDDQIRQLKLDLRERINTILGVAIGTAFADPLIASGYDLTTLGPLAVSQTFTIYLPWSLGAAQGAQTSPNPAYLMSGHTPTAGDGIQYNGVDALNWIVPVVLPVGVTITTLTACWYSTGTQSPTHSFRKVALDGTSTSIVSASAALTNAGWQTQAVFAGTQVVTAAFYRIAVTVPSSNTCSFAGFSLVYTSPTANYRI